ncbi:MAG: hydroxymethylpyrimidine/phosphomethylpyrimidine kinase [Myxococcales bacterium]|nr:hydroxymethylpyrimidine/phosphomethylpyrimidine kinase [Polyangiaceae bacterium]MDW8250177.1 hydroxymethylpyrimidine/phosphomethylpyrimidine kinase [Myxococcales bacterium]
MTPKRSLPRVRKRRCALTIAGLDPSGGAGIAADLRGFAEAGVWGCAACAVLTVQSTAGLRSVLPTPPSHLRAVLDELLAHQRICAVKTGALGSTANVRVVLDVLATHPKLPVVVDPVIIATRSPEGARLLDDEALTAMRELCAQATLVTPNIDEAEALLERQIHTRDQQREAAVELVARGAKAALVKGGHLEGPEVVDVLAFPGRVVHLATPRRQRAEFHGGGCQFAALLAGYLAMGPHPTSAETIEHAARKAKKRLTRSILRACDIGNGLLVLPTG